MKLLRNFWIPFLMLSLIGIGTARAQTNFEADVATSIDMGLDWLAGQGAFTYASLQANAGGVSNSEAAGLPLLALLEKRASGIPSDPPQGYTGASATDQGRARQVVKHILDRVNETGFYAYRDGNYLMGLSFYLLTGGPDKGGHADLPNTADFEDMITAINMMVDRTLAAQRVAAAFPNPINQGYWCYTANNCEDSSTTQFAVAGLASAKSVYSDAGHSDPGRLASINTALALARQAYVLNARTGSDNGSCSVLEPDERGHGYRTNYNPSLQQTASGTWVQILGGAGVNDATVQAYMRWIYNRYRWQDLDNLGNSWSANSYWYYLWSSFKGMEFLRQGGEVPAAGNISPDAFGGLDPVAAPACVVRQENRDPTVDVPPALFGGAAGHYAAEPVNQYYDFAYEILSHQCNTGQYACNSSHVVPSRWNNRSQEAYAILVLQRATGGACNDTDGDGVCDADDNCPAVANPNQEDTFGDPDLGDACEVPQLVMCDVSAPAGSVDIWDIRAIMARRGQPAAGPDDPADANGNGVIGVDDGRLCVLQCTLPRCAPVPNDPD